VTTILLIRHAETDAVGKWIAGWTPAVPLNRVGVTQATRLADRLASWPIAAVYSSPLERAVQTARPLANMLGLPVIERERLGELDFGSWTGQTFAEVAEDPEWRLFNAFRSSRRIPGGESMPEVQARVVAELACLAERHASRTIAVFSHGDTLRAAVAHYLGIPLDFLPRFEISPASVTELKLGPDTAILARLNDTGSGA
jgi:probable phosphoglycerate mutase